MHDVVEAGLVLGAAVHCYALARERQSLSHPGVLQAHPCLPSVALHRVLIVELTAIPNLDSDVVVLVPVAVVVMATECVPEAVFVIATGVVAAAVVVPVVAAAWAVVAVVVLMIAKLDLSLMVLYDCRCRGRLVWVKKIQHWDFFRTWALRWPVVSASVGIAVPLCLPWVCKWVCSPANHQGRCVAVLNATCWYQVPSLDALVVNIWRCLHVNQQVGAFVVVFLAVLDLAFALLTEPPRLVPLAVVV